MEIFDREIKIMSATKPIYLDEDTSAIHELPPEEIETLPALLEASNTAQDPQTALEYAQRAVNIQPDDPQVQQCVQRSIFSTLNQDAFVAFLAETEKHYVITFRNPRPIVVAKARTKPEIFPTSEHTKGERGQSMLWWLLLGLLPVGIGALILSPLTAGYAIDVLLQNKTTDASQARREKRLAWVTIFLAAALGMLGMSLTLLLVLHLIG
jgi:hypothetical protein